MTVTQDQTGAPTPAGTRDGWTDVCPVAALQPGRGAAALLPGGVQVAIFLLDDGSMHAVGQRDPYSGANVMSRGLVGSRGDRDIVVSPMLKQTFDLHTGEALDDPGTRLPVHPVAVVDGRVLVHREPEPDGGGP